ncbi:cell division protein FtsI/penicillin-binding protein 2 [Oleiphilus messinensis]|uniref:Peptidoglycan D,D-transpeptidase MrdA n=1 Tax=Oleiphilus messinensis TaxID=141451 RepID=A0A1Y0IC73_9GAMM|nr:penicillin-binding protein 2 [Oleiphilus messinensis]ARU58152.1 cell division protein FtsI/penicillin-binding protein 2 [Oleiphilus messinensis]
MVESRTLKDPVKEKKVFTNRALVSAFIVLFVTLVLIFRLYTLQIVDHTLYETLSDKNRMQLQSVAPTRGLIYDRNGELLADNRPVFSVTMVKELTDDIDATLQELGKIIDLTPEELSRFEQRFKARRRPYESVPIKVKLDEAEIARLAVDRYRFPGVEVEAELVRFYPLAGSMAHMLGYVGRISEDELKKVDPTNYSGTHYIGKLGVEKFYEDELHGQVGYQKVETNARGRVLRVLERVDPVPGNNLTLHIDSRLQARAEAALGERRGAVVAIEPETGGILALVSTPTFDPNLFVTGIDSKSYKALRNSPDIPLFNRALRGQYPPGSTIKPMMGIMGLDTGTVTRQTTIWDPGWYQIRGNKRYFRDWKRGGHGKMDLFQSIAQSCDIYFYDLAFKAGVDTMHEYMAHFGFGHSMAADIQEARDGILPSREWKRNARRQPWFPGDSVNMGIGQGFMLATPLQLATATAVLANRGHWKLPRLIRSMTDENGLEVSPHLPEPPPDIKLKNEDDWNFIFASMEEVMHGKRGTARKSGADAGYRMAGKTGTAQVVGIAQGEKYDAEALAERLRDHALFVGFAPVENPKIAVAVLVENGGGGSSSAAPVARQLFDAWLLEYGYLDAENSTLKNVSTDKNFSTDNLVGMQR